MRIETDSVRCPQCGAPAQLASLQHTDEQGHPFRQDFVLSCLSGHSATEAELMGLWATRSSGDALAGR